MTRKSRLLGVPCYIIEIFLFAERLNNVEYSKHREFDAHPNGKAGSAVASAFLGAFTKWNE